MSTAVELVVVGSVKQAPGATTVAAGLAACWPQSPALLVEADPHGGDLAARFGHPDTPGVASAAASSRHGARAGFWPPHVQRLNLGVDAVLAPASAEVAAASVTALAADPGLLREAGSVTVADVGRLVPGSVAAGIVDAADVVLLVAWAELDYLAHVAARVAALPAATRQRVRLLLRPGTYPAGEVGRDLGVEVAGIMPTDRLGAGVLAGRYLPARGWRRLRLPRAVAEIARGLSTLPAANAERSDVEVTA